MKNLRRIPFFASLPDDILEIIHGHMKQRRFRKGDIIFREGAPGDSMYIIESGQVEVVSEGKGNESDAVLAYLGPGSFFGEMALLLGERRSATVRVVLDAELWELHKRDLDLILRRHPSIALLLSRELSRRLRRTIHQPTVPERLNLIALVGEQPLIFVERLRAVTRERILVVDLGGLPPETREGALMEGVTVERLDLSETPDVLAGYLSRQVEDFGRIVMAISPHETPHARMAVELSKVVVEINHRTTPWIRRLKEADHWATPPTRQGIDRVARKVARKVVALVLGAGNARGLAHIGVLQALEEAQIPVDIVAGSSMGALIGALYAVSCSVEELKAFAAHLPKAVSLLGGLWDLSLFPRYGIVKGEKARRYLAEQWFHQKNIEELEIPLRIVATDVATGDEIVFTHGPVADAVRASIGIPGIFEPFLWNGRYLIDGAAINPVPTNLVETDANIIIACNVIPSLRERVAPRVFPAKWRLPSLFGVLLRTQEIMAAGIVESRLGEPHVLIQPEVADLGSRDYSQWEVFVDRGQEAAEACIQEIRRLLLPGEFDHHNGARPSSLELLPQRFG